MRLVTSYASKVVWSASTATGYGSGCERRYASAAPGCSAEIAMTSAPRPVKRS